jgi:putative phosphoribosyl transferase
VSVTGVTRVVIPVGGAVLERDLFVVERAPGIVLFAHRSGSGRHSPRNRQVAEALNVARLAVDWFSRYLAGADDGR